MWIVIVYTRLLQAYYVCRSIWLMGVIMASKCFRKSVRLAYTGQKGGTLPIRRSPNPSWTCPGDSMPHSCTAATRWCESDAGTSDSRSARWSSWTPWSSANSWSPHFRRRCACRGSLCEPKTRAGACATWGYLVRGTPNRCSPNVFLRGHSSCSHRPSGQTLCCKPLRTLLSGHWCVHWTARSRRENVAWKDRRVRHFAVGTLGSYDNSKLQLPTNKKLTQSRQQNGEPTFQLLKCRNPAEKSWSNVNNSNNNITSTIVPRIRCAESEFEVKSLKIKHPDLQYCQATLRLFGPKTFEVFASDRFSPLSLSLSRSVFYLCLCLCACLCRR